MHVSLTTKTLKRSFKSVNMQHRTVNTRRGHLHEDVCMAQTIPVLCQWRESSLSTKRGYAEQSQVSPFSLLCLSPVSTPGETQPYRVETHSTCSQ